MIEKFEKHTDVLVLGSGPSGFAAAYTAAKNGAEVVLVEQSGDVGGISTSGLMSHWTGSCGSPLKIPAFQPAWTVSVCKDVHCNHTVPGCQKELR
mgnify:CR=1 FL=1